MTIKASGRSALILATGLWVCLAGPSQAATDGTAKSAAATSPAATKYAKHATHHWKRIAYRRSGRLALKSSAAGKAADVADDSVGNSAALPPSVANANAQLASADSPAGSARAMSARASTMLQAAPDSQASDARPAAETQVVSSDQLNDVDRALQESKAPAAPVAMASADIPAAPAAPLTASSSNDSNTWDQTSLIGKIFIGFGALLTMASAARMFMA
jgi:hypothetical protein